MAEVNFPLKKAHRHIYDEDSYPRVVYVPRTNVEHYNPSDENDEKRRSRKRRPYASIKMRGRKKEEENVRRRMKSPPEEDLEMIARDLEKQRPPIWHR